MWRFFFLSSILFVFQAFLELIMICLLLYVTISLFSFYLNWFWWNILNSFRFSSHVKCFISQYQQDRDMRYMLWDQIISLIFYIIFLHPHKNYIIIILYYHLPDSENKRKNYLKEAINVVVLWHSSLAGFLVPWCLCGPLLIFIATIIWFCNYFVIFMVQMIMKVDA